MFYIEIKNTSFPLLYRFNKFEAFKKALESICVGFVKCYFYVTDSSVEASFDSSDGRTHYDKVLYISNNEFLENLQ